MQSRFGEIVELIKYSRISAIKAVNTELINLYWNVGAFICKRLANAEWGDKSIDELASFIQSNHPDLKGFNRRGLYRMKQFYETYQSTQIVSPVVTQLQIGDNNSNTEVVEYALNRSLSPTMVAEYKIYLPDKTILQQKFHELFKEL